MGNRNSCSSSSVIKEGGPIINIFQAIKNLKKSVCSETNDDSSIKFKDEAVNTSTNIEIKIASKNNEFELKFLVNPKYHKYIKTNAYLKVSKIQGYIGLDDDNFSQVRISKREDRDYGLITAKTKRIVNLREEYQYRIPSDEALEMISKCKYTIKKIRYYIKENGYEYTVDFFEGDNVGLVLAEVEFADKASLAEYLNKLSTVRPIWLEDNVTEDDNYYNDNLAKRPWGEW